MQKSDAGHNKSGCLPILLLNKLHVYDDSFFFKDVLLNVLSDLLLQLYKKELKKAETNKKIVSINLKMKKVINNHLVYLKIKYS